MDTVLFWLWMADVLGYGAPGTRQALTWCGDARNFYHGVQRGKWPGFLHKAARQRASTLNLQELEPRLADCERLGAAIVTPDDPDYPAAFLDLPDLPLVLYVTGSTNCLNGRRYASLVGTRRPSPYGRRTCRELALELARQGVVIVSGMADGLDSVAQQAAVDAGTPTIAVLGTPIDKTFPAANAGLRADIERGGGAVISEYPPGFSAKMQSTFLARNRLIAGLGELLCVTEASKRSGTMNTVGHARRYGRPVYAVPGSIFSGGSTGTNDLLQSGRAGMVCSPGDLSRAMGLASGDNLWQNDPEETRTPALSADAAKVLSVLGPDPMYLEDICRASGLEASRVLAAYTELELAGAALPGPGRSLTAAR